jgi:magnesium-transporting ATPase (P-type)
MENFGGNFKLVNDPKVLKITKENFLLCGSLIYTKWVLGFVMYNGSNTKIIRRNTFNTDTNGVVLKQKMNKIKELINKIMVFCIIISIVEMFLLILSMATIYKYNT